MSAQKVNWDTNKVANLLKKYPNSKVAEILGVSRARVSVKRKELNIPAPKKFKHKLKCVHCGTVVERKIIVEDPICYPCKKEIIVEFNREKREKNRESYNAYWRKYRKNKKRKK